MSKQDTVIVKIMGSDEGRDYKIEDIKLLPIGSSESFPVGTKVQAIWKNDGLWYNAQVAETRSSDVTEVFMVIYEGFDGEPEPVKADQIRAPVEVTPVAAKSSKEKDSKTYVTPAGYVIPEKLKIDPAKDSEKVIEDKKRKIHLIKSQQRQEKHTEELNVSKSKWQQFQSKFGGVRR